MNAGYYPKNDNQRETAEMFWIHEKGGPGKLSTQEILEHLQRMSNQLVGMNCWLWMKMDGVTVKVN